MSYYNKENFEYHFAIRTLYNLKHIDDEVKKMKELGIIEDDYKMYEVTQLINSFVGLLIVPKENAFVNLNPNTHFQWGSKAERILSKINQAQAENKNTYLVQTGKNVYRKKGPHEEMFTEADLIRHLRNAVAHTNFSVYPEKCKNGNEIQSLRFNDTYDLKGKYDEKGKFRTNVKEPVISLHQEFTLILTIEEVRVLLLAMCKVLLDQFPKKNGNTNWPEDLQDYIREM